MKQGRVGRSMEGGERMNHYAAEVCRSCGNMGMDMRTPEGHWGQRYCVPCLSLARVHDIHVSKVAKEILAVSK